MRSGGSLLIAAGTSAGGRSQIPIFGAHIIETRDYNRVPDRYMAVGSSDSSYPAVAKAGGWPGVKFFYALDVDPGAGPDAARVIVRLADQTPLCSKSASAKAAWCCSLPGSIISPTISR